MASKVHCLLFVEKNFKKKSHLLLTMILIKIIIFKYFEINYQCILKSCIIIIGGIGYDIERWQDRYDSPRR